MLSDMEQLLVLLAVFTHILSLCLGQEAEMDSVRQPRQQLYHNEYVYLLAGIGCFECHSVDGNVRDCEDPFRAPNETKHIYSRRCVVGYLKYQAYHCVKIKGKRKDNGQSIVIRTCSVEDWGSTCGDIYFEHGDEDEPVKLNGCLQSCHLDGCNGVSRTLPDMVQVAIPVILVMVYTLSYM